MKQLIKRLEEQHEAMSRLLDLRQEKLEGIRWQNCAEAQAHALMSGQIETQCAALWEIIEALREFI
jgi:hypothetical protein